MLNKEKNIKHLLGALSFILTFFIFTRPPIDADLWWHLRAGEVMWQQGKILLADPFSYTRLGTPWVNAFWISEIFFYLLQKLGGYFLITVFVAIIGAISFYIIYRQLRGNSFVNAFIIILAAATASPIWSPRPQIFSFLFVALLNHWLFTKQAKWIFIPLFAIWANIHGGWIWGFLLLTAHITGLIFDSFSIEPAERKIFYQEVKSLLGWSALSTLAIGLNPNGLAIWKLPFEQVNVSMQIQEWLSPDFHRIDFHPFLWMIFLLLATFPFISKPTSWTSLFKTIGFAYLTFVAQRNIALFAIVTVPLLSESINQIFSKYLQNKEHVNPHPNLSPKLTSILNAVLIGILSLTALGYAFMLSQPEKVNKGYPVEAIKWIQINQPTGRLFNSYNWGGYILWNLQEYPVFIDGRADLYGNEIITEWQSVISAQDNALPILNDWNINIVLVENNAPIVQKLKEEGWKIAFQDEISIILLREQ